MSFARRTGGPGFERAIAGLRARGGPLPIGEVAAALLALRAPPPPAVARRVVAAALGGRAAALGDEIDPRHLLVSPGGEPAAAPSPSTDDRPLESVEFVVVDLETTGLSPRTATILEIGAVRMGLDGERDRFATLVDPGAPIPAAIRALTGIDDAMVSGAPALGAALRAFLGWLDRSPRAPFVAHNAAFDAGFVARALASHGHPPLARPVLCTRRLAKRVLPELRRLGLDRLACHLGVVNAAPHRALGDAEATGRVLVHLLGLARERAGIATMADLVALDRMRPEAVRRTLRLPPGPLRHLEPGPAPA